MARKTIGNDEINKALKIIFNEILYVYQREIVLDDSRFKIVNKSRQIGISECLALEAVVEVLVHRENVLFVSRSQKQSVALLDKFRKWLDVFKDLGIKLRREVDSRTEIKVNNCNILSLSSNAVTNEGWSGFVALDEFGLHNNDEEIYKSIYPTVSLGHKLRIVSRPFGQSNLFYRIWTGHGGKYRTFSKHQIDIYQAVKQGCPMDIDSLKENIDEEGWQENYECKFLDESTAYFTYELLKSCISDIEKGLEGRKFIGIDVGRTNDATAVIVLAEDGNHHFHLIEKKEIRNTRFTEQRYLIREIIERHDPVSVLADKGSVGYQLVEDLEADYNCVRGVSMSNELKMEAFTNLKKKLEEQTLHIPDDIDLINQLHSVKREFGSNGIIKFSAERTAKGHADSSFGLALAIHATQERKKNPSAVLITAR